MATVTSTKSGNNTTYVVTDQQSNACTIVAANAPDGYINQTAITINGSSLVDGQAILANLLVLLQTGQRPNVIPGTSSFSN